MAHTPDIASLARDERQAMEDLEQANYSKDALAQQSAERRLQAARAALLSAAKSVPALGETSP